VLQWAVCVTHRERSDAYKVFMGKPEGKWKTLAYMGG
jgi:hypothetical protein